MNVQRLHDSQRAMTSAPSIPIKPRHSAAVATVPTTINRMTVTNSSMFKIAHIHGMRFGYMRKCNSCAYALNSTLRGIDVTQVPQLMRSGGEAVEPLRCSTIVDNPKQA